MIETTERFLRDIADRIGGLKTVLTGSVLQIIAMAAFLLTQDEVGLFTVAAGFGLGTLALAHLLRGDGLLAGSEPGGAEDWAASWDACHGGEYHRSYLGLPPPSAALCALQNALVGYPG